MRKTLTGLGLAFFLTLVPAAAASADTPVAPVGQSQVTPAPQNEMRDEGGGNAGMWGLLGLLGLLGLAGMRKQRNHIGTAEHVPHRKPQHH
ncbi:MYXO-CTERM domain-containing protein [Nonomuraea solani]|uniref:MYXO-CTERM domain-containing protein n=1 Tax=Nonomuraea solani TaxID=1144553 RepID=A0A1H6EW15_9ACTN|nr:WGxxGxxG family protein [Nonomuraea solani]SEH02028.1 MYXO-CTERM domain-containing protein [Nonomuraea solani]